MKNLLGPWYVGTLLVAVKCKYVQINSNISPVITLPNATADISLSQTPPLTVPLSTDIKLSILFILTDVHDLTNDGNEKRLPRNFLYCSAFL